MVYKIRRVQQRYNLYFNAHAPPFIMKSKNVLNKNMCSGQQIYNNRVLDFFFQLKNLHFFFFKAITTNYAQIVDNTTQIIRWCWPRRYHC